MNLSKYKTAVVIDRSPNPTDKPNDTSFDFKVVNVFEWEDVKDPIAHTLKTYTPGNKDKLFFYPGCDVPRYKVRSWAQNKNISITTNEAKATHVIAGIKTVSNCVNRSNRFMSDHADVYCNWLDKNFPGSAHASELKAIIKSTTYDKVLMNRTIMGGYMNSGYGTSSRHSSLLAGDYGFKELLGDMPGSVWTTWHSVITVTDEDLAKLNNIAYPGSIVYSEQSLIELVNENSAIIDQKMYIQIKTMFESVNREDKLMALSIMSNCNVKPSLHFLLLLLQEFATTIVSLKEHKHVNFKSLLKYLALPNWDRLTVDNIIQCLMDKDELTMQIVKEVAEGVKTTMQNAHNTTHFKINTITVSNDVKNHMLEKMQQEKSTQLIGKEE